MIKITVVGTGYVGMSLSVLLAQYNQVVALDIDEDKINKIQNKTSPISDIDIENFLENKSLNLIATTDKKIAYQGSEYVIVATPTDYDAENNYFNTSSVESVINDALQFNPNATIIIKSTVPVGFTENVSKRLGIQNVIFSPEFLREGKALWDNLNPSRIILGSDKLPAKKFAKLLLQSAEKPSIDIPVLYTGSTEAEAVKLFSNTYLAMRVAYFNELDTYCETYELNTKQIIEGVGFDPRIGNDYNNPSFGYGGYCLPKDTKQLLANFENVPNNIISAIVDSNQTRKKFIADSIIKRNPNIVGIYGLAMKQGSDNFRSSSIQSIMRILDNYGIKIVIHEPLLKVDNYMNKQVIFELEKFKKISDVIITNRISSELKDVEEKVYSRDISGKD